MASSTAAAESSKSGSGQPTIGIKRVNTDQGNKSQRLLRVDQIYSRKDRQIHFVKTAKSTVKPDRFGKTALVVRRIITKQGTHASTEIDVKSTLLRDALLKIFDGVEGLELNKTPPVASPELLFHASPYLLAHKEEEKEKDEPNQVLINDIGTAMRFIEEDFGSQIQSLASLMDKGEITFDLLWAIFPPRELIIAPQHNLTNQMQAMNLVSSSYQKRENGQHYYSISGRIVTHDGEDFGYGFLDVEINGFDGARKIDTISAFPLKYHPSPETVRKDLIERGRKYLRLINKTPICQEYTSTSAVSEIVQPNGRLKSLRSNFVGRVMVDPEAYRNNNDNSYLHEPYVTAAYFITEHETLSEEKLLVCAHWINGFSLAQKQWGQFSVSSLEDVVWNDQAFKKLVIDEDRRILIHALVRSHRHDEASFDDIVANKGKGLVGLLSGSPGVGKTLTAEAVAEVTCRPLYQVSTGELGIEPDKVDNRLNVILDISRRWGCVLLIDEADVFLATRGTDLARDTLVSIFLRRLEYFRGVLILTTNRKSEIDSAFQSRIHFSLHYPDLSENSRMTVWQNFLDNVAKTSESTTVTKADIQKLAKEPLNGRQIKNAVSCAVSISREEGKAVSLEHIERILRIINL